MKIPNPNVERLAPSPYTNLQDDNPLPTPPDTIYLTEDDRLSSPSSNFSASAIPSDSSVETLKSHDRPICSRDSTAQQRDTPRLLVESVAAIPSAVSPVNVSPLNIVKKSPTASPLHQTTFNQEDQSLDIHTSASSSVPLDIPTTPSVQSPVCANSHDSDGKTGIGLSLLQNLESGESDDGSISEYTSACQRESQNDGSFVEGLLYHNIIDDSNVPRPNTPTIVPYSSSQDIISPNENLSQMFRISSQSSSPLSTTPPRSLPPLSPPANFQTLFTHSPKSSLRSQRSQQSLSSWEGAGDIYDDYRYSRASMVTGGTLTLRGRWSSVAGSKTSQREAWDSYGYDQPPPPIPVISHRPSIDSLPATKSSDTVLFGRNVDSKKSGEVRKSDGPRKSVESQVHSADHWSCQELLASHPSPIHLELPDQAIRDPPCQTSEASRTLTPANFRHSMVSGASVCSRLSVRLSVLEQETHRTTGLDTSSPPPALPDSPVKFDIDTPSGCHSQSTPLQPPESQSLFHRTNCIASTCSSCDQEVLPIFGTSPTFSSTTALSLMAVIASASREKVEDGKNPEEPEKKQTQEQADGPDAGKYTLEVKDNGGADEEDDLLDVMQESTFETEHAHDLSLSITQTSALLPESSQAAMKGDTLICTPPPTSLVGNHVYPHSLDDSLVPSQLPRMQTPLRRTDIAESLSSFSAVSPTSHVHPACHQLTLADLREGGGTPIPGTNQRRTIFLPHPNAPKSPPIETRGPLFITSQQHSSPCGDMNPVIPEVVSKTAMRSLSLLASKPRIMSTIYGECDVELGAALGPVPITFSIQPLSPTSSQHHVVPQPPSNQAFVSSMPLSPLPPLPRSATNSPPLSGHLRRCESVMGNSRINVNVTADGSGSRISKGVVPRANFYPSGPSQRPRSRSYSALSSYSFRSSQEEGEVQLAGRALASDVRQTLKNSQGSSTSFSQSQIEATSPRSSPPSFGALVKQTSSKPLLSPLSQSFHPSSVPDLRQLSLSPTSLHLREATPYPNWNNLPLSKPTVDVSDKSVSSLFSGARPLPEASICDQAIDEAGPISVSNQSDCHSHSHSNPPSPAHHRQPSLRSRLSLPSLRRHRSRHDDMPSPTVTDHNLDDTVQVQDLDFKLVKPATQSQVTSSEDLFASNGRGHASMGMSHPQAILFRCATGPPALQSDLRSPAGEDFSDIRSYPSRLAISTHPITRFGADAEISVEAHRHRELKWMSLMSLLAPPQWRKSKKVRKLIHEGVPSSVRYLIWQHLTDGKAKVVPGVYVKLGKRERIAVADKIEEDIRKCFLGQPHLQGKTGPVLALLQAYLTMVPDVQYTRGTLPARLDALVLICYFTQV